jgi:hypothetical protein
MQPLHIPKGSRVYIGAPAQPLPENIVSGLRLLVSSIASLAEAPPAASVLRRGGSCQLGPRIGATEPFANSRGR